MEIKTEKSKVMVNSTSNISVSIAMDGKPLDDVSSFKYFGVILTKDGTCNIEIHTWIAITTAVITRLEKDMEEQHQLPNQVQVLQITGRIHPLVQV